MTPCFFKPYTSGPKAEHLFKVLFIGDLGVGKTSYIKRYVHQFFSVHYRATIGVDFALKVINWDEDTLIRLQLWDIAGQERFGNMTRVYYKEAVAALIVFDCTRQSTFDAVLTWKNDLDSKVLLPNGDPVPCLLLSNKCDEPKDGNLDNPQFLDSFCKQEGFIGWFDTSAKHNINVTESATFLVKHILDTTAQMNVAKPRTDQNLRVENGGNHNSDKSGCC